MWFVYLLCPLYCVNTWKIFGTTSPRQGHHSNIDYSSQISQNHAKNKVYKTNEPSRVQSFHPHSFYHSGVRPGHLYIPQFTLKIRKFCVKETFVVSSTPFEESLSNGTGPPRTLPSGLTLSLRLYLGHGNPRSDIQSGM